jgi:hypothetical protein
MGMDAEKISFLTHDPRDKVARWLQGADVPEPAARRIGYLESTCWTLKQHGHDSSTWLFTPITPSDKTSPADMFAAHEFDRLLAVSLQTSSR